MVEWSWTLVTLMKHKKYPMQILEIAGDLHWALGYFEKPAFTKNSNLHLKWTLIAFLTRAVDKLMSCWSFSLTATSTIVNRWPRSFPANEHQFKGIIRILWERKHPQIKYLSVPKSVPSTTLHSPSWIWIWQKATGGIGGETDKSSYRMLWINFWAGNMGMLQLWCTSSKIILSTPQYISHINSVIWISTKHFPKKLHLPIKQAKNRNYPTAQLEIHKPHVAH